MLNSLHTKSTLTVDGQEYDYFSLQALGKRVPLHHLPFCLRVLLENLLRHEDGVTVSVPDIEAFSAWPEVGKHEIAYHPSRVLMQDFTGVPALVDLAAMRDAMQALGGDPHSINPLIPVDLVVDHSVMVDHFGREGALSANMKKEMERNRERYTFLRWGQKAFSNFRVVPPGVGICHQVNLEYLAHTVGSSPDKEGRLIAYPDTLVGTDSHTTMVNGLSVLGWGVGGIEAEACVLGQPLSLVIPEVVGVQLEGRLKEGVTATDLVLTITERLRAHGVVGKFVEFYGKGVAHLETELRATVSNMAPEYGATCGFFPIDKETIRYLTFSGRPHGKLVEAYARAQGLWQDETTPSPLYSETLSFSLDEVMPSVAGPKRPQDRLSLSDVSSSFTSTLSQYTTTPRSQALPRGETLKDGDVVIAAITSCTNTSNPSVMIGAGLVAKKAKELGLSVKPWVKASLAPGSRVVHDYLEASGLLSSLESLGFPLVAYGCTTCIGNSGPLSKEVSQAIRETDMCVAAVLSGNRNFEGRVHSQTRVNYLASPPLVVAYALAGSVTLDLTKDPLGQGPSGPVYLKDVWPSSEEIRSVMERSLTPEMFRSRYADVFEGADSWNALKVPEGKRYTWDSHSTYIQNPPFFEGMTKRPSPVEEVRGARILALLGDSITTDHISPAGSFSPDSPAGEYLRQKHVAPKDFNSYGSRRGNHHVMMRGTLANIRIKNEMVPGKEGGVSLYKGQEMSLYEAAMAYGRDHTPLVLVGGKEYGTGSSRDWAAKGVRLLGVRVVLVESFERIHRSNLIGMGVLPLQFQEGVTRRTLGLDGSEEVDVEGLNTLSPRQTLVCLFKKSNGDKREVKVLCRLDTQREVEYYRNGGILHYALRQILNRAT